MAGARTLPLGQWIAVTQFPSGWLPIVPSVGSEHKAMVIWSKYRVIRSRVDLFDTLLWVSRFPTLE